MAPIDTKQKILEASLLLFNEYGISTVRLQQIADETGISVGNLAYHFNNKEAITESLINSVIESMQELIRQYGKQATLPDMDVFFATYYRLCNQYRFFNYDILEIKRTFPSSYELLQPILNKIKLQLERRFELCLQERLIHKDVNIKYMVSNVWLLMFFMPAEGQLNGKTTITESQYRRRLWDYIMLHSTLKGSEVYACSVEPKLTGK
jgi:AcrR family transcriptional regulator